MDVHLFNFVAFNSIFCLVHNSYNGSFRYISEPCCIPETLTIFDA